MYTDRCGVCRTCCNHFCHYNQYTTPYYNSCPDPCQQYSCVVDCQIPEEFTSFAQQIPQKLMMPLKVTKTEMLTDLARKSTRSKKKQPTKLTRRTSGRDSEGGRASERLQGTFVVDDSPGRTSERLTRTYERDDGNGNGRASERLNGTFAGEDGNGKGNGKGRPSKRLNGTFVREDRIAKAGERLKSIYGNGSGNGRPSERSKSIYGRNDDNDDGDDDGNDNDNNGNGNGRLSERLKSTFLIENDSPRRSTRALNNDTSGEGKNGIKGREGSKAMNGQMGRDDDNGRNGNTGRPSEAKNGRPSEAMKDLYGDDDDDGDEGNNGNYTGRTSPPNQMNKSLAAQICSNLSKGFTTPNGTNVVCSKNCTCTCRCGTSPNKPVLTKNGVPINIGYNRTNGDNDYGQYQNRNSSSKNSYVPSRNSSPTNLAAPQTSYSSHESNNLFSGKTGSQDNSFVCIYNTQKGRKSDSNSNKINSKPNGYKSPQPVYPMSCPCMAGQNQQQQRPIKTSCCSQYTEIPAKLCRQLDVITEEYEPADYGNVSTDYQDVPNYGANNGASTESKPKSQKSIEDFCCDFLNIVSENILESVQKSMGSMMEEYCCQIMEKVEAMCCKFESSDMITKRILCDLMEKMNEQDDNNLQQFRMLMQTLNRVQNNGNENRASMKGPRESPRQSNRGCPCNAEVPKDDGKEICCFLIDTENCKVKTENGNSLEAVSVKRKNGNGNSEYCCCKIQVAKDLAPNDEPTYDGSPTNDDSTNEPTYPYQISDDVDADAAANGNGPKCQCPETDSFTCIIESCDLERRQKSGAQEIIEPNQNFEEQVEEEQDKSSIQPELDNSSIEKIRRVSPLKFPNFLMTNKNMPTDLQGEEDEDTFETSGYASEPEDNDEEVTEISSTPPQRKSNGKRSSKRPSTPVERKSSTNPDVPPRNSTRLSRL